MKLTPDQKVKIFKQLEKSVSMSLFVAFDVFKEILDKQIGTSSDDFKKILNEMKDEIKKLELKDGKTPKKYVDYFTKAEIAAIAEEIYKVALPRKGKDYFTAKEVEELKDYFVSCIPKAKEPISKFEISTMISEKIEKNKPAPVKTYTKEEITGWINEIIPKLVKDNVNAKAIVAEINKLEISPELQIDYSHIKNGPTEKAEKKKSNIFVKGGESTTVFMYDLSHLTDGVTKTFTVPYSARAIMVIGSDFPSVLMQNNGFTLNTGRTEITLTTDNAPSQGSQLGYQYAV